MSPVLFRGASRLGSAANTFTVTPVCETSYVPAGTIHAIDERQNTPENLRLLSAARRRYADRKRAHRWRVTGTVLVATASPIVVLFAASSGPLLGAVAGLWVFASRTLLATVEQRAVEDARRIQERFDCRVLGLPANQTLGRQPTGESIGAAAERFGAPNGLQDWYPATDLTEGPQAALICQRSSVAWGQRLHREYAWVLGVIGASVGVLGAGIGIVRHITLADYLVSIFLPSLPALLDGVESIRAHLDASRVKGELEADMTERLLMPGGVADFAVCRAFQDQIFAQRGADPVVADCYYKWRRAAYERHMVEAAAELASAQGGTN